MDIVSNSFPKRIMKAVLCKPCLLLFPAILKLGVEAAGEDGASRERLYAVLVFHFSLSHRPWCSWNVQNTSLSHLPAPQLYPTFKERRSKGPSVLAVGLGNKWQRPFKGGRVCRCEVTACQPSPWELQQAYCRGLSTRTHLWVLKKKYPAAYE